MEITDTTVRRVKASTNNEYRRYIWAKTESRTIVFKPVSPAPPYRASIDEPEPEQDHNERTFTINLRPVKSEYATLFRLTPQHYNTEPDRLPAYNERPIPESSRQLLLQYLERIERNCENERST